MHERISIMRNNKSVKEQGHKTHVDNNNNATSNRRVAKNCILHRCCEFVATSVELLNILHRNSIYVTLSVCLLTVEFDSLRISHKTT